MIIRENEWYPHALISSMWTGYVITILVISFYMIMFGWIFETTFVVTTQLVHERGDGSNHYLTHL